MLDISLVENPVIQWFQQCWLVPVVQAHEHIQHYCQVQHLYKTPSLSLNNKSVEELDNMYESVVYEAQPNIVKFHSHWSILWRSFVNRWTPLRLIQPHKYFNKPNIRHHEISSNKLHRQLLWAIVSHHSDKLSSFFWCKTHNSFYIFTSTVHEYFIQLVTSLSILTVEHCNSCSFCYRCEWRDTWWNHDLTQACQSFKTRDNTWQGHNFKSLSRVFVHIHHLEVLPQTRTDFRNTQGNSNIKQNIY